MAAGRAVPAPPADEPANEASSTAATHATTSATAPRATRPERGAWWPDALLIALGALLVRIPSLFAPAHLGFDDGVYGVSTVAMREGFTPFRDIFSPQGPVFLPLVRLGDLAGLEGPTAPRVTVVLAGAAVAVATYFAACELMDRGRARLAAALVATSGVILFTTGPITGDGVAQAFATAAVAVALGYRRAPGWTRAIVVGLLAGAALAVKSLVVVPAVIVAGLVLLSVRRVPHVLGAGLVAVVVVVATAAPFGFDAVLDDYVRYHLDKTGERDVIANLDKLVTTFARRDAAILAVGVAGAVVAAWRRWVTGRRGAGGGSGTGLLWLWLVLVVVILALQDPMFRNHMAALAAPAALLAARWRPPWRIVAIAVVVAAPIQLATLRPLLVPEDYRGRDAAIVERLRELPDGAWAISDEPGLAWRARLGTDPFFADASVYRIRSGVDAIALTADRLDAAAANPRTCAVVATSPVRFGSFAGLSERLESLGYERVLGPPEADGRTVRPADAELGLYVRPCSPRRD